METPICDFVRQYNESGALRLHMPGHKGKQLLGMEQMDITEIDGADNLYDADGIIRQSERNASFLFGCETYYSTEGSSQCIRAMLYLTMLYAKQSGRKPVVAAARNVHKTFLSAAALLNFDVMWLYPKNTDSYLSWNLDGEDLELFLQNTAQKPAALYLTSPDYLGNLLDIGKIARICHAHQILLLVDNAHGAYLKFLPRSLHPIDLGADLCCSSAHKTLPVLTGGAYLHIAPMAPHIFVEQAKNAMALFGSTSPSYLILQSLDAANRYLADYPPKLQTIVEKVGILKERLESRGYCLYGNEPLKLTISAKSYGYSGRELLQILLQHNIVCEFADPDHLVLMITPETDENGLRKLETALLDIPGKNPIIQLPPRFHYAERVMSIQQAMFSVSEIVPVADCVGRILAAPSVSCPPAVPILVCGERIDEDAVKCFRYYGVDQCSVVCENL